MADDELIYTETGIEQAGDIVTRLREQSQAPALAWLNNAADEIELLRTLSDNYRLDLHATLIALNDLVAIPTDPNTHHHAQQTLRRIRDKHRININAIRPTRNHTYGT